MTTKRIAFVIEAAKSETDDCILWPFPLSGYGYGEVFKKGRAEGAHRMVLKLKTKENGLNLVACHDPIICNNRACVNPRHLRWGTIQENIADRDLIGTTVKGEAHHSAKLKEEDISEIRRRYDSGEKMAPLAREFGVSDVAIGKVVKYQSWKHLP